MLRGRARHERRAAGQSMVEYAMTVPVFLLIVLGILEFGLAFSHHLTMEYASREGARTGAALANVGGPSVPCANVDDQVIAAVQRVLVAAGSQLDIDAVDEIHIYQANHPDGIEGSRFNVWSRGTGPIIAGETVPLLFAKVSGQQSWGTACSRNNGANPDSIGVSVTYTYTFVTPLAAILGFFGPGGGATLQMSDRTVMALNPVVP